MSTARYYAIYKPYQTLSQFSPEGNKKTLKDYFNVPRDVYPVGRLDYDSEGLLILTNDRQLNQRLLHPRHAHKRTYYVQVDGPITREAVRQLEKGVSISINGQPHTTLPCEARLFSNEHPPQVPDRFPPIRFRKEIPAPWLSLTLTEGKNRQVRKMCAAVGFPVLRLVRYSIEALTVDGLLPAQMRTYSASEILPLLFG